ncbi:MAG TPA: AraC family transcriptional regulator [Mobilitalea sp.]|nr:AraC family transcriptional regulator [Mobilitalea sp.]
MLIYDFDTEKAFSYRWCGKFQSPSPDWMHLTRRLIDYELMVVTDGTLYIANDSTNYEIHKGQYLLMNLTDYQHGYKASDCSFYWLHFTYNKNLNDPDIYDSESIIKTYSQGHLLIPESSYLSSTERIIILMKQLQDSERRYHEVSLNNFLASAVLAEISGQSYLYKKYGEGNIKKQLYNDICDYITRHVSENITMDELSAYFDYNKKYLTTFFRKQSGYTIKHFILQTKMDHAKAELTDTNHSISQICYNIGFNDVHNFSNAFKRITGLSPSDYRDSFSKRFLNHN